MKERKETHIHDDRPVALIPAYEPEPAVVDIALALVRSNKFQKIVVVNDGSNPERKAIFKALEAAEGVEVIGHYVNLGKGASLKTGFNHIACRFPVAVGIVTLDADGQHLVEDVLNVAETLVNQPEDLVMGMRIFNTKVPLRNKIGNSATKYLFRLLMGQMLTDTQSGLRGIPLEFIPRLLTIESNGYEFELDMLLASKYSGRRIVEREIHTVYEDGNRSSHFSPLLDSMRIYFVLFRFMLASSLTAVIDYSVFLLMFAVTSNLVASQVSARVPAMIFNYSAVKKVVFYSEQKHSQTFPKYVALVFVSGALSYLMIITFLKFTSLSVISAKIISELIVFLANFAIQRDFIFTRNRTRMDADWNRYYSKPTKRLSLPER